MHDGALRRVVVLSDLHFGDESALLARPDITDELLAELSSLGPIDLLVLLGDIWDLWRTEISASLRGGSTFFRALSRWSGAPECVLVPGNHDFHLWSFSEEGRRRREMGWEEAGELAMVLAAEPDRGEKVCMLEGLPLWLRYPFLSLEVGGKRFLLMHGHHLDYFSRSFWWAKTAWLARWILGRSRGIAVSDIDRLNRPFFELLTNTAYVPQLLAWEYRFYGVLRFFARMLRFLNKSGGSPRRYTSVEENRAEAESLLADLLPGFIPDAFVFGHTHRAGIGHARVGSRSVLLANSGCWLPASDDETDMTYLVLEDRIRLRRLGEWEIRVDVSSAPTPRSGGRPLS